MIKRMAEQWGGKLAGWGPVGLRIVAGIIFALSGWMKFQSIDATTGFFAGAGIPAANFFVYLVATIELVGGIALIAGLWTRVAAKLLGIIMIVATLLTLKMGFFTATGPGFAFPLLMLVICFSLFTTGGGKYSMDK